MSGRNLLIFSDKRQDLVSHGFFKKGELAERVMANRGLDPADARLRNSVVFKVIQALLHAKRRGLVRIVEMRKGMCIWAPGDAITLCVITNTTSMSD